MATELAGLTKEILACTRCPLAQTRTQAVPGDGPEQAAIMFVGEGPGFHEDQQGKPFVGGAGQFLTELLQSIGLQRKEVYITNVVKCRPPGNRDPQPEEIEACRAYLDRQIAAIKPTVIVTLGRFSMARAFPNEKISNVHGKPRKVDGIVYVPMFHPAAALHQPSLRRTVEEDFAQLPKILADLEKVGEAAKPDEGPQQLSLF